MSESNLAPENRCKRLPRGKPFAKGEHGNPNSEFKPGQSGNPGGRPQSAPLTEALRRVLSMRVKDIGLKPTDKVSLAMAKRWAYEGLNGDVRATVEMANRVEGPPAQTLQHQGLENFYQAEPGEPRQREILARMVQILLERSKIYGLPMPEVVQEAERQIEDEREARRDAKAEHNGPPRTSSPQGGAWPLFARVNPEIPFENALRKDYAPRETARQRRNLHGWFTQSYRLQKLSQRKELHACHFRHRRGSAGLGGSPRRHGPRTPTDA